MGEECIRAQASTTNDVGLTVLSNRFDDDEATIGRRESARIVWLYTRAVNLFPTVWKSMTVV